MNEEFEEFLEEDEEDEEEDDEDYSFLEDCYRQPKRPRYPKARKYPELEERLRYLAHQKKFDAFLRRVHRVTSQCGTNGLPKARYVTTWIDGEFYVFRPFNVGYEQPAQTMEYMGRPVTLAAGPLSFLFEMELVGKTADHRFEKYKKLSEYSNGMYRSSLTGPSRNLQSIDICGMPFFIQDIRSEFTAVRDLTCHVTFCHRPEMEHGQHRLLRDNEKKIAKRFQHYTAREKIYG